jgi:two-component system KDP operon response regulator KdpE
MTPGADAAGPAPAAAPAAAPTAAPSPGRILLVEDEAAIRRFVRLALEAEGHAVFEAATLARAGIEAATRRPDLVVLDLGLPDGDGLAFLKDLRGWSAAPVIVLSARTAEATKIAALDAGADDYLDKPFGSGELLARVRAALRRTAVAVAAGAGGGGGGAGAAGALRRFGDVEIDLACHGCTRGGRRVALTAVEFRLLAALLKHEGKVLTHRHLLAEVWGPGHAQQTHYLRVYMQRLRAKLEAEPAAPRHLLIETGVGYRFEGGG